MKLWDDIVSRYPQYQLRIVTFKSDKYRLDLLNDQFDFLVGPFNSSLDHYQFIPIGSYRLCLSVNRLHPLANKKELSFKDLAHEKILIMKKGISPVNDAARELIVSSYPDVEIVDIEPCYDASTFNYCAESNAFLLNLEYWKDVHPSLKTIPLKEEYYLPYGIVISKYMNETLKSFIKIVQDTLHIK